MGGGSPGPHPLQHHILPTNVRGRGKSGGGALWWGGGGGRGREEVIFGHMLAPIRDAAAGYLSELMTCVKQDSECICVHV